jgi:hypothetical protein
LAYLASVTKAGVTTSYVYDAEWNLGYLRGHADWTSLPVVIWSLR